MTYDNKSYELAEHFLQDKNLSRDELVMVADRLAQHIQRSVEDWLIMEYGE